MNKTAIIVYAKYPQPGKVKTRLCNGSVLNLSYEESAHIYHLLLNGIIRKYQSFSTKSGIKFFLCLKSDINNFKKKYKHQYYILDSNCSDLGDSLFKSMKTAFFLGYKKVIFLGSDIPLISETTLIKAAELLDLHDFVLGPDQDGGCYLIASAIQENLFSNIEWSQGKDFEILKSRSKNNNLKLSILNQLNDIDNEDDLIYLYKDAVNKSNNLLIENPDLLKYLDELFHVKQFKN